MKNTYKHIFLLTGMSLLWISCGEAKPEETTQETTEKEEMTPPEKPKENTYDLYSFDVNGQILAISPLPGKVDLEADIERIREAGITEVVTLVDEKELASYQLEGFFDVMKEGGLNVYHSPITDFGLPGEGQMDEILAHVQMQLDSGKNVLIHCMGGYGRSGTVMGCYARKYLNEENPLEYVRNVRGEDAIETEEQEAFVLGY